MSDTTPETPTAGQDDLRKWATGECMKLKHGECRTLSCLMRGGYVRGTPCDSSVATCEPLEFLTERDSLAAQLAQAQQTIESVQAQYQDVVLTDGKELERLQARVDELLSENARLTDERDTLDGQLVQADSRFATMQQEIDLERYQKEEAQQQLAQAQQEIYETPPSTDHPTGTKWRDIAGWNGFACTENQKLIATLQEQLAQAQGEVERLKRDLRNQVSIATQAISQLRAELATVRAENAELLRDKARIDWLEAHGDSIYAQAYLNSEGGEDGWQITGASEGSPVVNLFGKGETIREAIDTALAKHQQA